MAKFYAIKQQQAVNMLLLFLCILLLGFVYLNSVVIDKFYAEKHNSTLNQTHEAPQKDVVNESLEK